MKILISLLALVQLTTADASLIAIMDSGTDISHKDLAPRSWINKNERAGSLVDLDGDGLPGDINGWDFIENSAKVFNDKYISLIDSDVKTFFLYYSLYELGKLNANSVEFAWLKSHIDDEVLMNKVNFVGGYIHGTHVAGLSVVNNSEAKVLSMTIIPSVYKELEKNPLKAPMINLKGTTPEVAPKTVEEFTEEVLKSAIGQVDQMVGLHFILNFHKADVVNQSFGIGFAAAVKFITEGFVSEVKRTPTDAEVLKLTLAFFAKLSEDGPRMFAAAPESLFVIAAGNDSLNNDLFPDFPADIQAENKIVVAATLGYRSLAEFSNYGEKKVDVAAPGVAITSSAPTNAYIALSGTSQATPFVTNTIAAMKDLNPALTARDLKAIIFGTVDVKSWLRGKVKTSGIVNKSRALKAAEFAKTQNIDLAISKARATIGDVLGDKSLIVRPAGLKLNFKPILPSLLPVHNLL